MSVFERNIDGQNKPFYPFTVSKGRSTRELKMSFSHNANHPIVLVDGQGDPQLGWRIEFVGHGVYDFDKLPKTLQPLVSEVAGKILDLELAKIGHRVSGWNSLLTSHYERVSTVVPQIFKVEVAHAVLARARGLGFENPLSHEALSVAYTSLEEFVDRDTHAQVVQNAKDLQTKLTDAESDVEDLNSQKADNSEPVQDVLDGLERLKRDLEAGWIQHDVGETLKDKVLGRLEELEWKSATISV
ncbi:hypothetical protein [Glutamicibacter ardleyensis]|uniref:hypothetical protein n=1 Tax=Glutamicibacter ardleyensis TaxID=225894 RepID=UPI003FD51931